MTHLYRISYEASSAGNRSVRSKNQLGDDLYQAIDRITKQIKRVNPHATIYIKRSQVFNRNTQEWDRI